MNLSKAGFAKKVYTENLFWYMDNILTFRDNDAYLFNGLADFSLDSLNSLDDLIGENSAKNIIEKAEKIRKSMYEKTKTLLTEQQVKQVSQVSGRNVELMFVCFVLSNITKAKYDEDIQKTFIQKLAEEGERTEIGYVGILRDVLVKLYKEKKFDLDYITESGLVKISNKEIYDTYNSNLKKEAGEGISPAKFKEYLLEFGFTDSLNRTKLEIPIPSDSVKKSRLCNIFTDRVLAKIGIDKEEDALENKIRELAKDTASVTHLDEKEEETVECVCCLNKRPAKWQMKKHDHSWGYLCEDCGSKLSEEITGNG